MLSNGPEHLEHHSAGSRFGVEAHAEDAEAGLLLCDLVHDVEKVAHRPRQPIQLRRHQDIVLAEVVPWRP